MNKMNLKNICEGMVIKNYQELCKLLEVEAKTGNSKLAMLKELSRYCLYTKVNRQYIIQKIYDTPKSREDNRMKYLQYVEPIILNHLSKSDSEIELTFNDLYKIIGLPVEICNTEKLLELSKSYFDDKDGCTEFIINYIVHLIKETSNRFLLTALNKIQKDKAIKYNEILRFIYANYSRLATQSEISKFKKIKETVRDEMGYKTMFAINLNKARKIKYWSKVENSCKQEFHTSIIISKFNIQVLDKTLTKKYERANLLEIQSLLRKEIKNYIKSYISKQNERSNKIRDMWIEKLVEDKPISNDFVLKDIDIENMNWVLEHLI